MSAIPRTADHLRSAIQLLIEFQNLTKSAVAEASGIKRPNLVGWLNGRNGISEERLRAVMRTLHIPRGTLDSEPIHRWSVSSWESVREVLDVLLCREEKERLEIFHVGRDTAKPAAILRCDAMVDNGADYPKSEVFFVVVITPAPLAPPLGLLTDVHLGCGVVRGKEPEIPLEALPEIGLTDLLMALGAAHQDEPDMDFDCGLLATLREPDEALEAELYSTVKAAGRENTRFMLGIAARDPNTVRAIQAAKRAGYTDEQIRGWVELLTTKPEFSKVLVEALI